MYAELLEDCEAALTASGNAYTDVLSYAYYHLGWRRRNVDGCTITPPVIDNAEYLKNAEFRQLVDRAKDLCAEYSRRVEVVRCSLKPNRQKK